MQTSRGDYSVIDPNLVEWETILWFGKHKGMTIKQVFESNPGYIAWAVKEGIFTIPMDIKQALHWARQKKLEEHDHLLDLCIHDIY